MKARKLRQFLNNTGYNISNERDYIAVGSPMCHDLISVNKKTLKVKYALDTFNEGKKAIKHPELQFIWDKLHELIESGEIHDIINGKDIIENPLPVFTVANGELIESMTDAYGWPNTDDNGMCMYDNTHFPTKEEAIKQGIKEYTAGVELSKDRISELKENLSKVESRCEMYQKYIEKLNGMLV